MRTEVAKAPVSMLMRFVRTSGSATRGVAVDDDLAEGALEAQKAFAYP